ncbi:type IV pilus secretin PilQ, partial [Escherichia coli]|nr:type IV pilus secretin PilQ [Escherichia coli]
MIRTIILTLALCCLTPAFANDEKLSLAFDDAPVERILQALADYQGINLLIAP